MSLLNETFDEFFTKKGIAAFISGSAGGMIYGTSVEKRRTIIRFLSAIGVGGLTAVFATGWIVDVCGISKPEHERLVAFVVGLVAMVVAPNVVAFFGRLRLKVPEIFSSVVEDAGDE